MLDDELLKNLHHVLLEVRLPPTLKIFYRVQNASDTY
jgi:hypothetical protein